MHTGVIHIGLDDTDTEDSPGTNQVARRLIAALPDGLGAWIAMRHQLLIDSRIPFTSQNGSASILVRHETVVDVPALIDVLRATMHACYVPGSDPGLCVATAVGAHVIAFGARAQREVVTKAEAAEIAASTGLHLEELGGTGGGIIGALAAVGLAASGDDGRVVHRPGWSWPDGFSGAQSVAAVLARGVDRVIDAASGTQVTQGIVDVGKHLRPEYCGKEIVLFVEATNGPVQWRAQRGRPGDVRARAGRNA